MCVDPAGHPLEVGVHAMEGWHRIVLRADAVHVELPNMLEDVRYFMERAGLSAAHAVQAGMVVASGADGIATVEDRFGAVDETLVRMYTPQRLVERSRSRRPSARTTG